MRKFLIITVLVVGISLSVALATSQVTLNTLAGLDGVGIVIENISGAELCNLTRDELQMIVELGLRRNGIKVLTEEEASRTEYVPYIYVAVTVAGNPDTAIRAAMVDVRLGQLMRLIRDSEIICVGVSYDRGHVLLGTVSMIDNGIKEAIKDIIDEFSNDYLKMNPIERPVQPKLNRLNRKGGEK